MKDRKYHENLNRKELVLMVGEENVERLESINCEPTSRCLPNDDPDTEWVSCLRLPDGDSIVAYYYTSPDDDDIMADNDGDGSSIDWTIDHYQIID